MDWIKHSFICKFNNINPSTYRDFIQVLADDLTSSAASTDFFSDQAATLGRRLGFVALPVTCLILRMVLQVVTWFRPALCWSNAVLVLLLAACLCAAKVLMGVQIIGFTLKHYPIGSVPMSPRNIMKRPPKSKVETAAKAASFSEGSALAENSRAPYSSGLKKKA